MALLGLVARSPRPRRAWSAVGSAAVVMAAASCGEPSPGELPRTLRVAVSTDLAVPDAVDGLRVTVSRGGTEVFADTYDADVVASLPDSLLLENGQRGDAILTPITVRVTGTLAGDDVVARSAELVFEIEEAKLLRLPLCASCVGVICDSGETCARGTCVAERVDADTLPTDGEDEPLEAECAADR